MNVTVHLKMSPAKLIYLNLLPNNSEFNMNRTVKHNLHVQLIFFLFYAGR